MLGVGYGAERDPNAECSHLGMGKQRHVFSAEAREAFNVFDRTSVATIQYTAGIGADCRHYILLASGLHS